MHIPPDLLAVPLLLLFVGLKALLHPDHYRRADTLTNLSCGLLQLAADVVGKGLFLALYSLAYTWRIAELTSTIAGIVAAFVLIDLCFYVFHRVGHRVNFFWAVHSVHHMSEEMNFSVGLRVSALKNVVAWPFYLPVALMGVPPQHVLGSRGHQHPASVPHSHPLNPHTRTLGLGVQHARSPSRSSWL